MVCPLSIPFIADYDETKYAQKSSDSVNDVVRDLLPFLVIVLIFWSMYTIIFSVIILRPSGSCDTYGAISRLLRIMRSGFFQMFGEFSLEELLRYYGL
ncbi:unnamed protein product [Hydatigera taeniaeformis]|uniref:RSN1_TM domain-containing protein n=1 Tax=Hydatigena taeniaeformis TaxID=6205 RepID=A0A0R3XBZ7_HYDTA|nr:unnamed protein product [Hydatigera taeniaeformis]